MMEFSNRSLLPALIFGIIALGGISCKKENPVAKGEFYTVSVRSGNRYLDLQNATLNSYIDPGEPFHLQFNLPVNASTLDGNIRIVDDLSVVHPVAMIPEDEQTIWVSQATTLPHLRAFKIQVLAGLKSTDGRSCTPLELNFTTSAGLLKADSIISGGKNLLGTTPAQNVDRQFQARVFFNHALDPVTVNTANVKVFKTNEFADIQVALEQHDSTLVITSSQLLKHFERYKIYLSAAIQGTEGYRMQEFNQVFYTAIDPAPKFPVISDDALLDLVQQQTFKYFWDFGHPVSGMARERNTSGDVVTTGGTGFGLMGMVAAVERGFITRADAVDRWKKMVDFLKNKAQRYHGAWSHWLNGSSGLTIPFSTKDNGADLVETSYLIEGLLTVRQYLNPADSNENQLIADINDLWQGVEWDWFTHGGQKVLYWHWSPTYNWDMNVQIRGYNECLITYFLAACSPTHPISADVYHQGWASNGGIVNNKEFFGYTLPLGYDYGGPLFFAHYSFMGLDPRNLKDTYAEYWTQNRNHTLINRAYCVANPLHKVGYSEQCWGLTASDNQSGYSAHAPGNDLGVITPTAALSSMPYTPQESLEALKFFYYQLGDRLWGPYGFYDAFNVTEGWTANSYLAIDEGPIVAMIENYRSGKIWNLFMSSPEVAGGAALLGFTY